MCRRGLGDHWEAGKLTVRPLTTAGAGLDQN
jgi:hypothetical protein